MKDICVNAATLRLALRKWQEAEWHWAKKFGNVPAEAKDFDMRADPVWAELDVALNEYETYRNMGR